MHLGALPFSMYNTSSPEQVEFLLRDSGAKIAVVEEQFRDRVDAEHVLDVDDLDELAPDDDFDFDAAWQAVEPDDPLTLIYTSGTTGDPKGVVLTHKSMLFTMRAYDEVLHYERGGRVISYLPMAHIAERNCSHYFPMQFGFTVTCCPDPREVMSYFPEVRPSWFFAVPRIFEKLKAAIESGPDEEPAAIRERLGMDQLSALNVGAAPVPAGGDRVLPLHRPPARRAVGDERDERDRRLQPARERQDRHRRPGRPGRRDPARRRRRGRAARRLRVRRLLRPGGADPRDVHRRRLAQDRRRRRARRRRVPLDRGPQEGADHQRGGQEHVALEHREHAQGRRPADRLRCRDRRPSALQRRADRPRSRRRRGRPRRLAEGRDRRGGRDRERAPLQGRADQAPHRARARSGSPAATSSRRR